MEKINKKTKGRIVKLRPFFNLAENAGTMRLGQLSIFITFLFLTCACTDKNNGDLNKNQTRNSAEQEKQLALIDTTNNLLLLDKIISSYASKKLDTVLFQAIWKKSTIFDAINAQDSVLKYDQLLHRLAVDSKNRHRRAKAESYLAYDYRERQVFDSAFYYYQKAKNSYLVIRDSTQIGRKLLEMGKIQYRQNDFYGSKESVTEALNYFRKSRDKKYIIWSLNELGNNYTALKDYESARLNYQKALTMEEDISNKILYQNNLAVLHSENNNYKEAIVLLQKAIASVPIGFKPEERARLTHNLAEYQWKLNNTNVLKTYIQALSVRKNNGDKRGLLSSYSSLAAYFININKNKSIAYADSLISLSKSLNIPKAETDALKLLMQIQPANNTYKTRYIFLKDSLYQQELKVKTQFAKMKYDDEQEKEQILLLEAETAERRAEIAEQKNQKIIFLSLSGLFLIGGISLFLILRQKHKKEKLREVYHTEKRISERLHDGLANDVFSLITQVENVSHPKNKTLLDVLENIYKLTREISHENSAILTGPQFSKEVRDLLKVFHDKSTSIVVKGLDNIDWLKLEEHKCVAIHRSLKELMVNMKKHSQASLAVLNFVKNKKSISISYKDNGNGCLDDQKFGVGLANTVSRIQSCGGTFNFTPNQGKGVEIQISVPY